MLYIEFASRHPAAQNVEPYCLRIARAFLRVEYHILWYACVYPTVGSLQVGPGEKRLPTGVGVDAAICTLHACKNVYLKIRAQAP